MATEVKLPRLGQGMESGTIVRWLKAEGDSVEKGEPLYELDTEKVTQEVEAEASGVLLRIAVQSGEVPVGQTVAVIGQEGESVEAVEAVEPGDAGAPQSAEKPAEAPEREPDREDGRAAAAAEAASETRDGASSGTTHSDKSVTDAPQVGGRIKASPLARRIARERGVELSALTGTGPDGRIVAEDVEHAEPAPAPAAAPEPAAAPAAAPAASGEIESVPLTSVRKTIARRLTAAWQV